MERKFSALSAFRTVVANSELTAEEKGLGALATKTVAERQALEAQYDTWQYLIQSNALFQARLEQARLADYFEDALKLTNVGVGQ